jgi:hypothetical protein
MDGLLGTDIAEFSPALRLMDAFDAGSPIYLVVPGNIERISLGSRVIMLQLVVIYLRSKLFVVAY